MASRDDMVIVPRLGERRASRPVRERRLRGRMQMGTRKRRMFRRVLRARAARRAYRAHKARRALRAARMGRGGMAAARMGTGAAARGAGRAAIANPIGLIVAAVVVAGSVIARLATGQSFETMGNKINQMLLGDLDEQAVAQREARRALGSDSDVARIIGSEGRVNSQIASLHKDLAMMRKRELDGAAAIERETGMQNDSTIFDQLIVRARSKFLEAWNGAGGPAATEKFRRKYGEATQTAGGKTAR